MLSPIFARVMPWSFIDLLNHQKMSLVVLIDPVMKSRMRSSGERFFAPALAISFLSICFLSWVSDSSQERKLFLTSARYSGDSMRCCISGPRLSSRSKMSFSVAPSSKTLALCSSSLAQRLHPISPFWPIVESISYALSNALLVRSPPPLPTIPFAQNGLAISRGGKRRQ